MLRLSCAHVFLSCPFCAQSIVYGILYFIHTVILSILCFIHGSQARQEWHGTVAAADIGQSEPQLDHDTGPGRLARGVLDLQSDGAAQDHRTVQVPQHEGS